MKVVINRCWGGFSLSEKAKSYLKENYNFDDDFYFRGIDRNHKGLIEVVENLGNQANGRSANLKIVEIPNNIEWEISDYDGFEKAVEKHRKWC